MHSSGASGRPSPTGKCENGSWYRRAIDNRPYESRMMNVHIIVTHTGTAPQGAISPSHRLDFTLPQAGFHLTAGQISLGL